MNLSHYLAHTSPLFHLMEVLPVKKICYHTIGLMMYKFNDILLPNCLSQLREFTVFMTTILEVVNFLEYPQVLKRLVI